MITIPYHGTNLFINEKTKLSEMKDACPLFFKNSNKGEKKIVYRGCLIVVYKQDFTGAPETTSFHVYAFDTRREKLDSIGSGSDMQSPCINHIRSVEDSKRRIDLLLDSGLPPFSMSDEVVEVMVRAKVKVTYCRNQEGLVTSTEVSEWLSVGEGNQSYFDKDKPGDTFTMDATTKASKIIVDRFGSV